MIVIPFGSEVLERIAQYQFWKHQPESRLWSTRVPGTSLKIEQMRIC